VPFDFIVIVLVLICISAECDYADVKVVVCLSVCLSVALPVVFLCGINSFIRDFMLSAHQQRMTDGDYVYISTDLLAVENYESRWMTGDTATDGLARQAFQPLLQARNINSTVNADTIIGVIY